MINPLTARRLDRAEFELDTPAPALAPLSFRVDTDGGLDLLLVPNFRACYACRLPADVAAVLLPVLEAAGRALLPLLEADGDAGPLAVLLR